jgi:hypothetical protein
VEDDWDFEVLEVEVEVAGLMGGAAVESTQVIVVWGLDLIFSNGFITNVTGRFQFILSSFFFSLPAKGLVLTFNDVSNLVSNADDLFEEGFG